MLYYLNQIQAVQIIVVIAGEVWWSDLSRGRGIFFRAYGCLGRASFVLAQSSDVTRRAHAVAVRPLVAAVLARRTVGAVLVAVVDEVGQFEVGEANLFALSDPKHVKRVDSGDCRVSVLGEAL